MDVAALHEGNRDAWDRTARAGYTGDIEARIHDLRGGVLNLMEPELRILAGLNEWCRRAIHLQCSHGQDALSLWKYGAHEIIGVDISQPMLDAAKLKSDALDAPARWIRCDVLETPQDLDGTADLVYTGRGAICWMMDLSAWAAVVYRLLRPGGKLFLFEGHPLDTVWDTQSTGFVLRDAASYFEPFPVSEQSFPRDAALRAEPNRAVHLTSRLWTLGETVTTLVRAGLHVELLEEHPEPFWDQFKEIPTEELKRLPHTFALLMTKPSV